MTIDQVKPGMRVVCPTDWAAATTPGYDPPPMVGTVISVIGSRIHVGDLPDFDGMTWGIYEPQDLEPAPTA